MKIEKAPPANAKKKDKVLFRVLLPREMFPRQRL